MAFNLPDNKNLTVLCADLEKALDKLVGMLSQKVSNELKDLTKILNLSGYIETRREILLAFASEGLKKGNWTSEDNKRLLNRLQTATKKEQRDFPTGSLKLLFFINAINNCKFSKAFQFPAQTETL